VERILAYDKNKDGKLDKQELPERMQRMMERGDTNQDGVLDKKELETMAQRLSQRPQGQRPGGAGGRPAPGDAPRNPDAAPRGQNLPKRPGN
jgi:Ca2+-binding EF-hand superfamily protein